MKITAIDIVPVRLPLREPFVIAYATYPDTLSVLVHVRTADGGEGWGEATPDPNISGETWQGVAEILRNDLAPALIGHEAWDREAAGNVLDRRVEGAPAAKAALDIALHDLAARTLGIPLWQLLGGKARESLHISRVVSIGEPEEMANTALRHVNDGFRTIKVKVGEETDSWRDVARVMAVRDAIGPEIGIKVDVNQGWRYAGPAIQAIRAMAPARPLYIEQPVVWWDLEGLAEVRRQTGAVIMIDEGCHTARDMLRVISLRAADLVNIKLMKCGGLLNALKLNAIAEAAGIAAQIGTMVESSIASAAGLHAALSMANVKTVEMGGPLMLTGDVGDARSWYHQDRIDIPESPGLGITVDLERVKRFSDAWWTVE